MRERWKALLARFDKLSQRERALVAAALVGGVLLIGNSLFIDLPLARAKALSKQWFAEQTELQILQVQLASLQHEMRDPDEDNRSRLAAMHQQLADLRGTLVQHEKLLVPPQDIPGLLEQLVARHAALRLVSLRTLPSRPANQPETPSAEEGKAADKTPALTNRDTLDVWKHGVEIRLQGNYTDLTAYLADLERLPQRLVWGEVRFKAEYPKSELHLKIYTYSLDPAWLRL